MMNNNNGTINIILRHHLDPMRPSILVLVLMTPSGKLKDIQFHPNVLTQTVRFHYGGMVLRNQTTVRECGILRNIVVQWSSNPLMPINVTNHYDSTQFKVYVKPSTKVKELKTLISARLPDEYDGSPFLYKVYFCGVELQVDEFAVNQTVSEFGIYNFDVNLDLLLHSSHDFVVDD
ncbi:hypothetical protein Tco_1446141 [Tanacetum coccineum]